MDGSRFLRQVTDGGAGYSGRNIIITFQSPWGHTGHETHYFYSDIGYGGLTPVGFLDRAHKSSTAQLDRFR